MTHAPHDPEQDAAALEARARLRKADVWTGLVLAVIAALMIAEALTYPLEGTYAGVRNAWYVSPALFPLIVGGALLVLSGGLITVAVRDHARLAPSRSSFATGRSGGRAAREPLFIVLLLTSYIVGLIPRVDFVAATTLFLFVFIASYTAETGARARALLAGCLVAPAGAALGVALIGRWPAPRSGGQLVADALVAAAIPVAVAVADRFARGGGRRRVRRAALVSLTTAVLLAALFKHGLLTPLPREGLGTLLIDAGAAALGRLAG